MSHPRVFAVETKDMTSIVFYKGNYGTLTQKRDSFAMNMEHVDLDPKNSLYRPETTSARVSVLTC